MQKNEFQNRANIVRLYNLRIAPRKVRVVVDMVRNMGVEEALAVLRFSHKKAALDVAKMIESGVANIQSVIPAWAGEDLFVARAFVDAGPTLRRFMPRAQGRAGRIDKRTSQVTIELRPESSSGAGQD
jgi:large subunit ribosomal protein L22